MTHDQVALLFIVGKHSFAGAVDHRSTRVLDVLNDVQSAFLHVRNAAVFQGFCGTPIAEFSEATLQKSAIEAVILTEEQHEAPLRRRFALVDKQAHPVFALLSDYEIRGTVMLERSVDPELLLNSQASAFFPVVAASVTRAGSTGPPITANVAFVNKQKVSLLEIDKRTVAPAAQH